MITGTMRNDVYLLGTSLHLYENERVKLVPATNLPAPDNKGFFASPVDGKWRDGVRRGPRDSIHINPEDVEIDI